MVAQPFADFTWRHARKIAAERGVDDANETAVAVVLAALLRRAGQGPESRRAIGRTRAVAALPPALPEALAALPAALDLPAPDGEPGEEPEITGTVVGFGLFDPFGEDEGPYR